MLASFINDPEHWRQRAEEARTIADQMNDPQSKEAMLKIAEDYERLGERAERRARVRAKRDSPTGRIQEMSPITDTKLIRGSAIRDRAPLRRAVQRCGTIVATPILSGLHHQYARI